MYINKPVCACWGYYSFIRQNTGELMTIISWIMLTIAFIKAQSYYNKTCKTAIAYHTSLMLIKIDKNAVRLKLLSDVDFG